MPRHSPDALKTLDRSHRQCPSRSRAKTQNRERTNIRAFLGHRKHETACNSSSRPAAVSSQHDRPYKKQSCRQKDQLPETEPNDGGQAHQSRRVAYPFPSIQPPAGTPVSTRRAMNPAARCSRRNRIHESTTNGARFTRSLRTRLLFTLSSEQADRASARPANLVFFLDDKKPSNRPLDTNLKAWWSLSGSNRRPSACKADALPAELRPLACGVPAIVPHHEVVGPGRFELPTSPLSGVRSNQLSYGPDPMNRFMIPAPAEVVSSAQSRTRNKRAPGERTIIQ